MAYLPPQEVDQVQSLLSVISDPKAAQKVFDKLSKADKDLDQKKLDIQAIADEARNKFEVEAKKAQDLQAEASAQISLADDRLQQASSLELKVKDEAQKNEDVYQGLKSLQKELSVKAKELNERESQVSVRENATSLKETQLVDMEASLDLKKQDLDARFAKLREAAQ